MSPIVPQSTVSALTHGPPVGGGLEDMPRAANGKFPDLSDIPALQTLVRQVGHAIAVAKPDDPRVTKQTVLSAGLTAQAWRSASFAPTLRPSPVPLSSGFTPAGRSWGPRKTTRSTSPDSPPNSDASSRPLTTDRPADPGPRRRRGRPLAALAVSAGRAAGRVMQPASRSSPVRPQRVVASNRAQHQERPLGEESFSTFSRHPQPRREHPGRQRPQCPAATVITCVL